jgi:hypothetical protein
VNDDNWLRGNFRFDETKAGLRNPNFRSTETTEKGPQIVSAKSAILFKFGN